MTRDVLRCKCGKPVGIVRLNGRTLRLAHQNTGRSHVVRLARPASDSLPGEVLARTGAPHVGTAGARTGAPFTNPGRRDPEGNHVVRALRPSEGGRVESRGAPLLRDSAPFPLSAGRARESSGDGT